MLMLFAPTVDGRNDFFHYLLPCGGMPDAGVFVIVFGADRNTELKLLSGVKCRPVHNFYVAGRATDAVHVEWDRHSSCRRGSCVKLGDAKARSTVASVPAAWI